MSGELLNDEFALVHHPLAPFEPRTVYRIRMSIRGAEIVGCWDKTADPPKKPEEMTEPERMVEFYRGGWGT